MDMRTKGRAPTGDRSGSRKHPERLRRGERHGNAKLSNKDVLSIRMRRASGESQASVAKAFGVAKSLIYSIDHELIWRHV